MDKFWLCDFQGWVSRLTKNESANYQISQRVGTLLVEGLIWAVILIFLLTLQGILPESETELNLERECIFTTAPNLVNITWLLEILHNLT
jgi:hypothetical protein